MKPYFIKMICENLFVALPTERFFKEILTKKREYIGLKNIYSFGININSTSFVTPLRINLPLAMYANLAVAAF